MGLKQPVCGLFAPGWRRAIFNNSDLGSGRLDVMVRGIAEAHHWNCRAELIEYPDQAFLCSQKVAVKSGKVILD